MRRSLKPPVPPARSPTVASRVAVKGHPLHPVLVVYPIACLTLLPLVDLLHLWRGGHFWAQAGWWLNVVGLGGGLLAAVAGMADMFLIRVARRHPAAWAHFLAGVMLLAVAAAGVRLRLPDPAAAVWPWGLFVSGLGLAMTLVAGWLGGDLTFRYGIGVHGHPGPEDEDAGREVPP
ncbi:MAG TPA: DUF2231 domain-containing protein [Pseudoxanthomonas sp.]|nr:DUF2231 domain-containing protein [Pseudoxanthomonas sp.]